MKRQRSFGDGLDDDRRRFYDRGSQPPPPPRRPSREYEGDRFDRRKGFGGGGGGGGSYDSRYREYPSPREYGGDRTMHRSESFSGFRREFPKGFRSERDRPQRDGDGSSAWRRPGGGWRDTEGSDEYRAPARLSAAASSPARQTSRSRSPSEPRRRLEVAKVEKSRKHSSGISEMEEGEVAPDAEPKARPAAVERRKHVEPSRPKEKGLERSKVKKVDSEIQADLRAHGKGVARASHPGNAGKEEGKRRDGMVADAGKPMDKGREKSTLKVGEEVRGGHGVQAQDFVATDATKSKLSTSPMWQNVLQEEVKPHEETTNSVNVVGPSTSSSILKDTIQEEAAMRDETIDEVRKTSLRQGELQEEVTLLHRSGSAADEIGKSTSPPMRQEELLEAALVPDGTAYAVDEVRKTASPGMLQEVLQEEVMQRDGTANAVDTVEIGSSSGLLREAMKEKMPILDEIVNTVDDPEPVSYSSLLKEAMHEEELTLDATANTTDVAGQCNSSEEVIHGNTTVQETTNGFDVAGESSMSTEQQGEAMSSLHQHAPQNKEFESLTAIEEKMAEPTVYVASHHVEQVEIYHCEKGGALEETTFAEAEVAGMHENVDKQVKRFDMEARPEGARVFLQPIKEYAGGSKEEVAKANMVTKEPRVTDKENGIAFDVLAKKNKIDRVNSAGGSLDSTIQLGVESTETSISPLLTSVKQEDDPIKIGKLDLSLSLSGCSQKPELKCSVPKTASLVNATCSQPLQSSSFRTNSDGLTGSLSLTTSQILGHNPSCSLTQQLLDDYEHSVGSKPLFAGLDQMSYSAGWQAQLASDSTQKGGATPLLHRVLQTGHMPDNTLVGINGHNNGMSSNLRRHASIQGVSSPTHSRGSDDSGIENIRYRRQLTRERSSSSLTKGERQQGEQLVINGAGVIERVISKVVSEPLHHTGRMLQEMTDNSIAYLREAISEMIVDPDKRGQIIALQEALKRRSDLNSDMLLTCPRVLMEILVAIRTGLSYFIKKSSSVSTSDLVNIFLNLKCRNLSCQSVLPVDNCDCKICQRKTGFCSSCMCIVCAKFDSASNTCGWVGCDVCLHWCHTDCGLHHLLIRKGQSASRAYNTTEMQFHCRACGHPSEMFGFVKEVFRTCARQWRMETLVRELRYVERIFSASDDARGKRVGDFVKQMLIKLENKAYHPEVVKCVVAFFSDDDANLGIGLSVPLKGIPCSITEGIDGIPSTSRKASWKPFTLEGLPALEKATVLSTSRSPSVHRKSGQTQFQAIDNKPVIDELDSLVRLKQAEAHMYQERANDARNQVDDLRHIVMVKGARIEEDYATKMAELDINELQERCKQKIEELQVFERTHHEFLSMKTRMEASIRKLLLKMEAMRQN